MGDTEMNEAPWEITEKPSGTWFVQEEGTLRAADGVLICGGLTKEQAMYRAAASGRVLRYAGMWLQKWEVPK